MAEVVMFGRRPGRIKEIVKIELDRPRPLRIKRSPAFIAYEDKIWGLIEQEVRESLSEERAGHASGLIAEPIE
jgi:NitT/TauT family transport system ATP-binding protein